MISIKSLFMSALLCLSPIAALSDTHSLQGEDAPEFKEAVQAWLNGDDLAALRELSEQAQQGNTAAQILLASIASRSSFHSHVTSDLDRKERIALLRKSGGLSGKSWLTEAQLSEPLALALLQVSRIGEKAPAISALVEFGEPLTAMIAAQSMLLNGEAEELISVLQGLDASLPREADVLLGWALFQASQGKDTRYAGSARVSGTLSGDDRFLASELAWGGYSISQAEENPELLSKALVASGKVRAWTPMRRFCEEQCASTLNHCTLTAGMLSTSPLTPRSPLESVVSNEAYWASDRVFGDLARSTLDLSWAGVPSDDIPDACFLREMKRLQEVEGHG